jgi:decaprenyl-phosphate phosphoribosyltransferase
MTTALERTHTDPRELVLALRPRQWSKNLLVLAAPMAAGDLTHPAVMVPSLLTAAIFTIASAGGYLLNDVCDIDSDRAHPDKRLRPVAAGTLDSQVAVRWGVGLALMAVALAGLVDEELALLLAAYSALTLAYGVRLKRVAGLELVIVASGFVLRPLAGAVAGGVPPSAWFLSVCCLGALTIAPGKRLVELARLGPTAAEHRASLRHYSAKVLGRAQLTAAAAMGAAYLGWALSRPAGPVRSLALLSALPLLAAVARVVLLNRRGEGGAPEDLLRSDRTLQISAVGWLLLFAAGVVNV